MGEVADVLRATLKRLGPNGENWSSGEPRRGAQRCVALTLGEVLERDYPNEWHYLATEADRLIGEECGVYAYGAWNDDPHTTWEDVQLVLKRALARAEDEDL